jgi:hypothetical protein
MATVTLNQMREQLLTVDQLHAKLAVTEPLDTRHLSDVNKIAFRFEPEWVTEAEHVSNTSTVGAVMRIDGEEFPMTKEAAFMAASQVSLTSALIKKMPSTLLEQNLNYFYSAGMGAKEYNALTVQGNIAAFTRPTLVPFSNLQLLEQALAGIKKQYGDTEVLADYKFHHSLQKTDIRLIVPTKSRDITNSYMADVPTSEADTWSAGVHLSNSLIGKGQTAIEAYMFRWWCTNGCTTNLADVGTWSRRSDGQQEDVYEWAARSVEEVLGGMEGRFDEVQALTEIDVAGNTADVVRDIFERYSIPVAQRNQITENLLNSDTLTMYSVMNAITSAANDSDISDSRADGLMRVGGQLPTATFDTLKAKVWREGHTAEPDKRNPYEIAPVTN